MPIRRREQAQLTGADFLMGAAVQGEEQGRQHMSDVQQLLWDMAGGLGEPDSNSAFLQAVINSPLKPHESDIVWVVEEALRVGLLRRDYETAREAVALGLRLALKFDTYLRVKGTVFMDVDPADIGRGQGYRELKPLPGAAAAEVGEEFIAVAEGLRCFRGSYAISTEFIRTLKQEFDDGAYNPPLTLSAPVEFPDQDELPPLPVRSWAACPTCGGGLVAVGEASECRSCRRIWVGPKTSPTLNETGMLVGTEGRLVVLANADTFELTLPYIRGPRRGAPPLPA
jgi:hypothetical protein